MIPPIVVPNVPKNNPKRVVFIKYSTQKSPLLKLILAYDKENLFILIFLSLLDSFIYYSKVFGHMIDLGNYIPILHTCIIFFFLV